MKGRVVSAVLVGGVIALSACQTHDRSAAGTSASSVPEPTAPSTLPSTTMDPTSSADPPALSSSSQGSPAECKKASLSVTLGAHDAATGHRSITIVFRNTGSVACRMAGYPGVDGLAADGSLVAHAARTMTGFMGGVRGTTPPVTTLRPGESTSATVEGTASTPDGSSCAGIKQLLVTAPNDTASTRLPWDTDVCGNFQVHPITS